VVARWVRRFGVVGVVVGLVGLVGLAGTVTSAGLSATVPTNPTYPRTHDANLTGKWRLTLEMEVGRATPLLELVEKEGKLSGTYTGRYGSSPVEGAVDGKTLAFTVAFETTSLEFRGAIKDDGTLAGTAIFGELGEVTWTAAREK
jgi:hypothetical protein